MAIDPRVWNFIRQGAIARGLDPRAVGAVALSEGGLRYGSVGDQGTSYGPFQLHVGGALPRGRSAAWANSPAGINYALDQIAQVAQGLTGRAAIANIVRRFERPADPGSEIERALGHYQTLGGAAADLVAGQQPGQRVKSRTTMVAGPRPSPIQQFDPAVMGNKILNQFAAGGDVNFLALPSIVRQSWRTVQPPTPKVKKTTYEQVRDAGGAPTPAPYPSGPGGPGKGKGGIREAFYDPLGAYDEGTWIAPIGGHSDHVHLSFGDPRTALAAMKLARKMGLRVGENPYYDKVDPVHTEGSYHYQTFAGKYNGRQLGKAADISGTAQKMSAFWKRMRKLGYF